ncbi:MAG: ATP-binding cassette domain-containing protein [Planctomycetes bacterium]|nr:ATP-binding cassette domain-containing protein [Planctomycetota bacterium]
MSYAIEIANYCYHYSDGTDALCNINLNIEHGERVALIGPNGAGKSTLLLAMNLFVKGKGRLLIDGIEGKSRNTKKIRSVIGTVLQNPDEQLFMPTVFEDVAFGPLNMGMSMEEASERANETLKEVGLGGKGSKAPYHLSAGQKRAAAIATILSMKPKIITMDEPDTSLDPRNRKTIVELLGRLSQTLLVATCNMDFAARVCKRVVLINNGEIIADGKSHEVMSDAELMECNGLEVPSIYP